MNTLLLHTFSTAISSNAMLFLIAKICYVARTMLLYHTLSAHDFATWATLTSTIFLVLLWIDCGLRKSIPRFAPLFTAHRHQLLAPLLALQLTLLACTAPFMVYSASYITTDYSIILLAVALYVIEGINAMLRSLYHAYFHNRFFNHISALSTAGEMITIIIAIIVIPASFLVPLMLLIQCTSTTITTIIAIIYWPSQQPITHQLPPPARPALRACIHYTIIMGITSLLISISERNFLVPFLTYCSGITTGNLFKIANDGALFFYRLIIKTIGSADIALLAHVDTYTHQQHQQYLMRESVQKLSIQITRLVVPLLGILVSILPIAWWFYNDPIVFHAFLIMTIGYIIETIGIPYERLLEIKEHYTIIGIIYSIYTIAILILFFLIYSTWIGFLTFIIGIHGVRLVMSILMRYIVYRYYRI